MDNETKDKLISFIIAMVMKAITEYGIPYARVQLQAALDAVGNIDALQPILKIVGAAETYPNQKALLIDIKNVCLPQLPQDAKECHTPDGWRDADCDGIADKDEGCKDEDGFPTFCTD